MIFLLDTNALSWLIREDPRIEAWLSSLQSDDRLVTCAIARGEILFGIARLAPGKSRAELTEKSSALFDAVPCEPVPSKAGDHYAAVKISRLQRGLALDENDLWIASTALALGATLVTGDRDFEKIADLRLLDPRRA
jgi:predicted nucleic acid-binding protein